MKSLPMSSIALNNSAYISNNTGVLSIFQKTQQNILRQQPISSYIKINQSSRKIQMEPDLQKQYQKPRDFDISKSIIKDLWNSTPNRKGQYQELKEETGKSMKTQRKPIFKVYQQNVAKWLNQLEQSQVSSEQSWIKKRDKLAARAEIRRQEKIKQKQMQQQQKIRLEQAEKNESDIEQENTYADKLIKQQKVNDFLTRQRFSIKEKEVLRQMRQFCLYGSIKLDNTMKIYS